MVRRPLGKTGVEVSPIGLGAFKIGRNEQTKYAHAYALPTDEEAGVLLNAALDAGINLIDTAPAYGLSEQRIGKHLAGRRREYVLCTKAGEQFEGGRSRFDYSRDGVRGSVERSARALRTERLDIVLVHSNGEDEGILSQSDAVETLRDLQREGVVGWVGFSGKTVAGARTAMRSVDVLMVEYHAEDRTHEEVIREAKSAGVGVLIKKGLASGRIPAERAIAFLLGNPGVSSVIVGGLSVDHLQENVRVAEWLERG